MARSGRSKGSKGGFISGRTSKFTSLRKVTSCHAYRSCHSCRLELERIMDNYASYRPGTFTIDVSRFEIGPRLFHPRDMPAFLHEYCHYIQDITTISSIFGFSLWMYDIVNLTNV